MHANLGQLHGSADINIEINKAISGVVHTCITRSHRFNLLKNPLASYPPFPTGYGKENGIMQLTC